MQYFVVVDTEGFAQSFYIDAIHGSDIPASAIPITVEQHADLINHQGQRRLVEGRVVIYEPQAPVITPPMPALTRRQLRLALLSIGITTEHIEAIIAAIPDATEQATALIEWQDANAYERNHPLIEDIAAAIMVPAGQIDALWLWAAER